MKDENRNGQSFRVFEEQQKYTYIHTYFNLFTIFYLFGVWSQFHQKLHKYFDAWHFFMYRLIGIYALFTSSTS